MKKDIKREYEIIRKYIDLKMKNGIDVKQINEFINKNLLKRLEENDIPFENISLFKDVFLNYLSFINDKKIKFNESAFKEVLKDLETFYKENKDEEDIIKNNVIERILKLSLIINNNKVLINLYYMNIDNLNNLFILLEILIEKLNNCMDYNKETTYYIISYLNHIFSIRVYFNDENAYLTYCINSLEKSINSSFSNFIGDEYENFIKSKFFKNIILRTEIVEFNEDYNKLCIEGKLNILNRSKSNINDKIENRSKYIEELKQLRETTITMRAEHVYDLKNFYTLLEHKNKSLNDLKHKKYDELYQLIKNKEHIIIVEEEGSQAEKTIESIEEELNIDIIKVFVDDFGKITKEDKNEYIYQLYLDAYQKGNKLCLICNESDELFNIQLFHYYNALIESFKIIYLEEFGFRINKHPEFRLIIVIKKEKKKIEGNTANLSEAENNYYELKSIEGYKKILFKDEDYPLMDYLYKNDSDLYNLFKVINKYICEINNDDILHFIKYRDSKLYKYDKLFDMLFYDKDNIKDLNVNEIDQDLLQNNYIKELINYFEEEKKEKEKERILKI